MLRVFKLKENDPLLWTLKLKNFEVRFLLLVKAGNSFFFLIVYSIIQICLLVEVWLFQFIFFLSWICFQGWEFTFQVPRSCYITLAKRHKWPVEEFAVERSKKHTAINPKHIRPWGTVNPGTWGWRSVSHMLAGNGRRWKLNKLSRWMQQQTSSALHGNM